MTSYNASYTEVELAGLNLPGYRSAATVNDIIGGGDTDWQPVLSLSVFSESPTTAELEVLTAIRRNETPTHPHVVSTPTSRFPKAFEVPLFDAKSKNLAITAQQARADETLSLIRRLAPTTPRADFGHNLHAGPKAVWAARVLSSRDFRSRTIVARRSNSVGRAGYNSQTLIL